MDKIRKSSSPQCHSRTFLRHSCIGRNPFEIRTTPRQIPAFARMAALFGLVLLLASCSGPSHNDHGPLAQIKKHSKSNIEYTVSSDEFTAEIEKVAVTNAENDILFFIPNRVNHLVSFPCNNCHTKALGNMVSDDPTGKKAHWNIKLNHATADALTCVTCHSSNNVEYLRLNNKKEISFNQSQKVCAQCHSTQSNDWVGGAHGKTIGGWAPPRVSNTCVNCHDPHSPAFETRWPSRLNTVKIQELDPN